MKVVLEDKNAKLKIEQGDLVSENGLDDMIAFVVESEDTLYDVVVFEDGVRGGLFLPYLNHKKGLTLEEINKSYKLIAKNDNIEIKIKY